MMRDRLPPASTLHPPASALLRLLPALDHVVCDVEDALQGLAAGRAAPRARVLLQRALLAKVVPAAGHHGVAELVPRLAAGEAGKGQAFVVLGLAACTG